MAERWRISQPPRGIGNSTLYRYLSDTANALNQLPAFSLSSTITDMNTSGITANSGTFGFDIGSSATTFYMKESDGTQGWSSIASHGYVDAEIDSIVTYAFTPASGTLHSYDSVQGIPEGTATEILFEDYEGTSNISPTGAGYPATYINSTGTYFLTFNSSSSAPSLSDFEYHLVRNGTQKNFCAFVDYSTTEHRNLSFSLTTFFASGTSIAITGQYTSVPVSTLTINIHHHALTLHKI